jgi:hypothetical protein
LPAVRLGCGRIATDRNGVLDSHVQETTMTQLSQKASVRVTAQTPRDGVLAGIAASILVLSWCCAAALDEYPTTRMKQRETASEFDAAFAAANGIQPLYAAF